jgi:hypothetical protein
MRLSAASVQDVGRTPQLPGDRTFAPGTTRCNPVTLRHPMLSATRLELIASRATAVSCISYAT